MKKLFYKIIATASVALSMVLPAVAHAQQSLIKLNGTAIVPVQSAWTLGNALTNGIFNSITVGSCTGCGTGGGGGSAANPIGGLQYSTPVGTTTGFAASANVKYSTTTQVLSILNSSTTNATTTNLAVTGLSNVFAFINSFGSIIAAANGSVSNALLANSAVTVTAGTGLSGGGSISLGSSAILNNTGVISVSCTTITCSDTNPASFSVGNGAISNAQLANNTIGVSAGTGLSGGGTPALGGSATISLTVPVVATNGGTGTTTAPTLGQVLVGQANGTYAPQATSTLGITGGSGSGTISSSTLGQIPVYTGTTTLGGSSALTWDNTNQIVNLNNTVSTTTGGTGFSEVGSSTSFFQHWLQNTASGGASSGDYVVGGDKSSTTSTSYYADFGYANTGSSDSLFPAIIPQDAYLYNTDGRLVLFTASSTATDHSIPFYTGGATSTNLRLAISDGSTTISNELIASSTVGIGTTTTASSNSMVTVRNKLNKTNILNLFGNTGAAVVTISNAGVYTSSGNITLSGSAIVFAPTITANTFNNNTCGALNANLTDTSGNVYICGTASLIDGSGGSGSPGSAGVTGQVLKSEAPNSYQTAVWTNLFDNATLSGQIPYNVSGSAAFTNNFFYDATNVRLGIGSSTPSARLSIMADNTKALTTLVENIASSSPTGTGTTSLRTLAGNGNMTISGNFNAAQITGSSVLTGTSIRSSLVGSATAPANNSNGNNTGPFYSTNGTSSYYISIAGATTTTTSATGFGVGTSTSSSRLISQGSAGSTNPVLTIASSSGTTLFGVSSNGTTTISVLGSHFGTGASTAIPCVYNAAGDIGYMTITSLLASGSCLAP